MRLRRVHLVAIVAVGVALLAASATMPTDDGSVSAEFERQFARTAPEVHLDRVGDDVYLANLPRGAVQRLDVAGMQRDCRERPRSCGNEIASAIITVTDALDGTALAGGARAIRASIESRARVPDVIVSLHEPGLDGALDPAVVSEPLASDLVVRYVLRTDYSALPVGRSQLQALNLGPDELRGIALENMRTMPRVRVQPLTGYPEVWEMLSTFQVSELLIDLPRLDELANGNGERVWVAVPQASKLFFVRREDDLPALERAVDDFARQDDERLTRELFVVRSGRFEAGPPA